MFSKEFLKCPPPRTHLPTSHTFLLIVLATLCASGCTEDSTSTQDETECTSNADCVTHTDGKTQCDTTLHICVVPEAPQAKCGDGHIDSGEACDSQNLNEKSCKDVGTFIDGTLACNGLCLFDTSQCVECTDADVSLCQSGQVCSNGHCVDPGHVVTCGDGIVEGNEQCDQTNLNSKSCADFEGFAGGTLKCQSCAFDTSGCLGCVTNADCANRTDGKTACTAHVCTTPSTPVVPVCGNNDLETGEDCDGSLFRDNKTTCASWDARYTSGTVSCKNCNIDYSQCTITICGNDNLETGENCDGTLFKDNKTACSAWDSKYKSGSVSCNLCEIDYSGCSTDAPECSEDEAECVEKELSLKQCVNGKYVTTKCPLEKPYCKTDAEACSGFNTYDSCSSDSFIPHVGYSLSTYKSIYLCPQITYISNYVSSLTQGNVNTIDCDKYGSGDCMYAKRGYGVAPSNAKSCTVKGEKRVFNYDSSGSSAFNSCQKCKVNQNGELYWMYVPATYSIVNNELTCTPWADDID